MWSESSKMRPSKAVTVARNGTAVLVEFPLLQRINREPTQQLGVEIGGLLGKHLVGKGDIADLLHAHRINQERHLDLSALHLCQRFGGLATIRNVLLIANGFLRDLQNTFQQALVQLHDVQRLLAQRKLSEQASANGLRRVQQKCTLGGDREQRRSCVPCLLQNGSGARRIDSGIDLFQIEEFSGLCLKLCSRKRWQAEHEPVRRQNDRTRVARNL